VHELIGKFLISGMMCKGDLKGQRSQITNSKQEGTLFPLASHFKTREPKAQRLQRLNQGHTDGEKLDKN
jgi:hypothetical protein